MRLHFEERGAGPPAVLVHGTFSWGIDSFARQLELADSARIILVDRVGFGLTPGDPPLGWHRDAPALTALLRSIGPAHVVGHSYGAVVAMLAAGTVPELIRSLVLIEPSNLASAPASAAARAIRAALAAVYREAASMTAREFRIRRGVATGGEQAVVEAALDSMSPADWDSVEASRHERLPDDAPVDYDALRSLSAPKVMVVGTAAVQPNLETARQAFRDVAAVVAARAGARLVAFEGSGHNPQITEPDRFNSMLRDTWREA